jgi:hypothetical protein
MTAQRVVFHYGIELEGLKYNGPELGELRRRMGTGIKVELTFDPGDLGHINVFDPLKETYICVPAVDQAYATGLSFWQHKVIRRYAQRQMEARTDIMALAQAKAEIRALVERDFNRKSTRGRKRHARFMEDHSSASLSEREANQPALTGPPGEEMGSGSGMHPPLADQTEEGAHRSQEVRPASGAAADSSGLFTDDEVLPVFEAALDLPRSPVAPKAPAERFSGTEEADE